MSDIQRLERQIAEVMEQNKMLLKMMTVLMKSQKLWGHSGHYHIAGGYCWGNTPDGASFLVLYPKADYLKEKICRVYADDYQFAEIPEAIRATQENTGLDTTKDKEWAQKKGVYHLCPTMGVLTSDGKETQMGHEKRFAGVLWVAKPKREQPPTAPETSSSRPPSVPGASATGPTAKPATNGASAPPMPPTAPTASVSAPGASATANAAPVPGPSASGDQPSRLDLLQSLADLLYSAEAEPSLAALCRQHTAQKRSDPTTLTPDEARNVLDSLRLRQKLHAKTAERWGPVAPDVLRRNCLRVSDFFTDSDAEISDEQVETLLHGIAILNANDTAKETAKGELP